MELKAKIAVQEETTRNMSLHLHPGRKGLEEGGSRQKPKRKMITEKSPMMGILENFENSCI